MSRFRFWKFIVMFVATGIAYMVFMVKLIWGKRNERDTQ